MTAINMAHFLPCTENEGPGKRSAIWVQGCHFDCPGCCNPELQPFIQASIVEVEVLMDRVNKAIDLYRIEGITLLGGDPMLQAKGLSLLAELCQQSGLSVMVFTGFTLDLLKRKPVPGSERLLEHTDVLVDGLYLDKRPEKVRNWCGSSNQKFHYFSDKYNSSIETNPLYQP